MEAEISGRRLRSGAAMVPFAAKWLEPLRQKSFTVVFRKHHLSTGNTRWMYAYLTRPVKGVAARLTIERSERLPTEEVAKLERESLHSQGETLAYANGDGLRPWKELFVHWIKDIEVSQEVISLDAIKGAIKGFHPPASVLPLTEEQCQILDELGGFRPR